MAESDSSLSSIANQSGTKRSLLVTLCRDGSAASALVSKKQHRRPRGVLSNRRKQLGACQRCHRLSQHSLNGSSSQASLHLSSCSSRGGGLRRQQKAQYHQLQQLARLKANNQDLARVNAGLQLTSQRQVSEAQQLHRENLRLRQRLRNLPELRTGLMAMLDMAYRCVQMLGSAEDEEAGGSGGSNEASACAVNTDPAVAAANRSSLPSPIRPTSPPPPLLQPGVRGVAVAPSASVIAEVSAELSGSLLSALSKSLLATAETALTVAAVCSDETSLADIPDIQPDIMGDATLASDALESPEVVLLGVGGGGTAHGRTRSKPIKSASSRSKPRVSSAASKPRAKSATVVVQAVSPNSHSQRRPARSTRRPVSYLERELEEETPSQAASEDVATEPAAAVASAAPAATASAARRTVMAVQKRPGQLRYIVAPGETAVPVADAAASMAMPPPASKGSRKRRRPPPPQPPPPPVADHAEDPFSLTANRSLNLSALPDTLQGLRERCQNAQTCQETDAQPRHQQPSPPVTKKAVKKSMADAKRKPAARRLCSRGGGGGSGSGGPRGSELATEDEDGDFVSLY